MLRRKSDCEKPYDVVFYVRISSNTQNKNSLEQLEAQMQKAILSMGLPWKITKVCQEE